MSQLHAMLVEMSRSAWFLAMGLVLGMTTTAPEAILASYVERCEKRITDGEIIGRIAGSIESAIFKTKS